MISYIIGQAININEKSITVLTSSGVGYEVYLNINDLLQVKENENVELFIHSHIKEDAFTLFGFRDKNDKSVFEKLISVSGVGPKTALSIISVASTNNIIRAIESKNIDMFPKIPGLGKKTLEKIIIELNGKFDTVIIQDTESENVKDAKLALEALGYNSRDIYDTLTSLNPELDMNSLIKESLKILSKGRK